MTSHEEALTRLLAGGPVPVEASDHVGSCPACRAELAALREIESGLRAARPAAETAPLPVARVLPERRRSLRWAQTAAAAALLVGLLGGFAAGRHAPGLDTASAGAAPDPAVTYSAADDSTFALLSAVQTVSAETPTDEELADYLESHWGG